MNCEVISKQSIGNSVTAVDSMYMQCINLH